MACGTIRFGEMFNAFSHYNTTLLYHKSKLENFFFPRQNTGPVIGKSALMMGGIGGTINTELSNGTRHFLMGRSWWQSMSLLTLITVCPSMFCNCQL